jgi:signal transduction histidine kinase
LGFAPPGPLRRTWQEPELLDFLKSSVNLAHAPDDMEVISLLEQRAAAVFGAPWAHIGLWDAGANQLRFTINATPNTVTPSPQTTLGKAFLGEQPVLGETKPMLAGPPGSAEDVRAVLAAPLSSGDQKLGVLAVYTPRTALFSSDDLVLVDLLAAQVAATITSRRLIADLAYTRGQREATIFKEDFLSAAAHDLKTPLTTLVAQTQMLERQLQRDPSAPMSPRAVARLGREAQRLRSRILDLLDAAQAERGQLVGERTLCNLSELVIEDSQQVSSDRHPLVLQVEPGLFAQIDRQRIEQLLHNLLENAVLYSPSGGSVEIELVQSGSNLVLSVADHGIGIPPHDLPRVFERFFRGSNVNDRHFAGMGLSLFICRAIVEQHGGMIAVTSQLGEGSRFAVTLPAALLGADNVDEPANPDS